MTQIFREKNGISTEAEIATHPIYIIKRLKFQKASTHFMYLYTHKCIYSCFLSILPHQVITTTSEQGSKNRQANRKCL